MNRIILCSILLNESQTERQSISWDEDDHRLYSSACEEPLNDGYTYATMEDAVHACTAWEQPVWGFQWHTYYVKPEYYELWGAWPSFDNVTLDDAARLADEWEVPLHELFQQLNE